LTAFNSLNHSLGEEQQCALDSFGTIFAGQRQSNLTHCIIKLHIVISSNVTLEIGPQNNSLQLVWYCLIVTLPHVELDRLIASY